VSKNIKTEQLDIVKNINELIKDFKNYDENDIDYWYQKLTKQWNKLKYQIEKQINYQIEREIDELN
jgi:hypothetical protein